MLKYFHHTLVIIIVSSCRHLERRKTINMSLVKETSLIGPANKTSLLKMERLVQEGCAFHSLSQPVVVLTPESFTLLKGSLLGQTLPIQKPFTILKRLVFICPPSMCSAIWLPRYCQLRLNYRIANLSLIHI